MKNKILHNLDIVLSASKGLEDSELFSVLSHYFYEDISS